MKCECPKCKESFEVVATAHIPSEQIMHLKLTSQQEFFPASVVAGAMTKMENLLLAVGESHGAKMAVFIKSVTLAEHELTIGFLITNTR